MGPSLLLGEDWLVVFSLGVVWACPVGRSAELVAAASLALGDGELFTWGPSVEFGGQAVLRGGLHVGVGAYFALWKVESRVDRALALAREDDPREDVVGIDFRARACGPRR